MISYLVTVCNEHLELRRLLSQLVTLPNMEKGSEIVVLYDSENVTDEVLKVLGTFTATFPESKFRIVSHALNRNFADFKNFGNKHCTKEWIFQIDADEYLSEGLAAILLPLLETGLQDDSNVQVDLLYVPRVNIVDGLTMSHIKEWGWQITGNKAVTESKPVEAITKEELEVLTTYNLLIPETDKKVVESLTYQVPLINFPDYQSRVYRNKETIKWTGAVHESITGFKKYSVVPTAVQASLMHVKSIDRQVKQNDFYATL